MSLNEMNNGVSKDLLSNRKKAGTAASIEQAALAWEQFRTDPLNFPTKMLGITTMWEGAERIIRSIFENKRVAIHTGHSLSKDWSAGLITLIWLLKYYPNAKVILTAPTQKQVKEVMFGEIEKQYARLMDVAPESFPRDAMTSMKLFLKPECYAIGFTTKETNEMVGKFQGFKSPNILVIVSEAEAVEGVIFEQINGLLTSSNARLLELGNPLVPYGKFFDHCTNPRFGYKVIKMSCFESPNVIAGKEIIPGLVTKDFIDGMERECGEDYENDPMYQARVLGEFPQQSKLAWIPLSKIRAAVGKKFIGDDTVCVGGLDVGGEGSDETVHCVLKGRQMIHQDCFRKAITPETVGWMRRLVKDSNIEMIAIDEGYNPGVLHNLVEQNMPAIGVMFGSTSPNERYENKGTYIWALLRDAFMNEEIGIMDDPVLVSQLAARRVEPTPKGKLRLESKRESKKHSPDRADALALAWYARKLAIQGQSPEDLLAEVPSQISDVHRDLDRLGGYRDRARRREQESEEDYGNEISSIGSTDTSNID